MSPRICDPGGRGLLFPLLESEQAWHPVWRAFLYVAALTYIFLGVGIVADKFMESIEIITSKKLRVRNNKTGKMVTVRRWNNTVANLTLLALGSSAPEILLSILEIVTNKFHSGALGPSTIVGSAAFNLLVIIAVCIYAVPSPEIRVIKEYNVYIITAVFSIVAYLWLVLIVQVSSPDVVEPWEGCSTLAWFPVLIIVSYMADVGYFRSNEEKTAASSTSLPPPLSLRLQPTSQNAAGVQDKFSPILDTLGNVLANPAGVLSFDQDTMNVVGTEQSHIVKVPVLRCNGADGTVACKYRTDSRAGNATPGRDYIEESGCLTFAPGVRKQEIEIEILPKQRWECSDSFQVILENAAGGVIFNPHDDGGNDTCILTINIQNGNLHGNFKLSHQAMRIADGTINVDRACLACSLWKDAILESMSNGAKEGEASAFMSQLLHVVSFPWRLTFAVLIPPAEYAGGWICFTLALVYIGGLTTLIIDFAELFGCVTGCDDSITAITFVALGTSMPDLFASRTAACQDETADASIVNVTGSNSVNVFLGIGLPWAMASLYWQSVPPTADWLREYKEDFLPRYPNGAFVVRGGDLGFSVVVFLIAASAALAILYLRRTYIGGELGGPIGFKTVSAALLVMLWFFYIALSIWKVQNPAASFSTQIFAIIVAVFILQNSALVIGVMLKCAGFFDAVEHTDSDRKLAALEEGDSIDETAASAALKQQFTGLTPGARLKKHLMEQLQPSAEEIGFDSIELDFADDEASVLSLHSAALVCSFVARLKRRSLKRRQLLGLTEDYPCLEAIFGGSHQPHMYQGKLVQPLPPLPPPAYSPPDSPLLHTGESAGPVVMGRPLVNYAHAGLYLKQGRKLSLAAAGFTCLTVVKLRKKVRRAGHIQGHLCGEEDRAQLIRSDSFHSAVESGSHSLTYMQPAAHHHASTAAPGNGHHVAGHIADVVAAGVCAYAAGQLAQPALLS